MSADIRKTSVIVEEIRSDIGRPVDPPTRKAAAIAVIRNPFAGRYVEDLTPLMDIGAELGGTLGDMCVNALGIRPDEAESYGKAAIVGEQGEWEHAAAILHPKLGAPLRKAVEKGAALVPSVKKLGGPGTPIDIPLGHKDAAYVRSHFDGIEVRLADAPRADEIPVAVTDSGVPSPASAASPPTRRRASCARPYLPIRSVPGDPSLPRPLAPDCDPGQAGGEKIGGLTDSLVCVCLPQRSTGSRSAERDGRAALGLRRRCR